MKKILALGGSNSSQSINKMFAVYAAGLLDGVEVLVADLNDFELPLYGPDLEKESGIPQAAHDLFALIGSVDGIVLSLAEYNGSYATAFKNVFDWMSRIDGKVWQDKPMLLMATSPGARGGAGVLAAANTAFPHLGGNIVAEFSLPSFQDNFVDGVVVDGELQKSLQEQVMQFESVLTE